MSVETYVDDGTEKFPAVVFNHFPGDSGHTSDRAETIKVVWGRLEISFNGRDFQEYGLGEKVQIPPNTNYFLRVRGVRAQYERKLANFDVSSVGTDDAVRAIRDGVSMPDV